MNRFVVFLLFLFVGSAAVLALAGGDQPATLIVECGRSDLPHSKVEGCLARVRAAQKVKDGPALQSLQARLEQRATEGDEADPQDPGDTGDDDSDMPGRQDGDGGQSAGGMGHGGGPPYDGEAGSSEHKPSGTDDADEDR